MSLVLISLFSVVLVALLLLSLMKNDDKRIGKIKTYPYLKRPYLYTPAQRSFKQKLQLAVGDQYDIACNVHLTDLLTVKQTISKSASQKANNVIQMLRVDFVLSDKETSEILCAITLKNNTAPKSEQQIYEGVDNALRAGKIPLMHFSSEENDQPAFIADKVKKAIHPEFAIHHSSALKTDDIKILINPEN